MHSLTHTQTYLPMNVDLHNKQSLFKIKNMEIPLNHNQVFCRRKIISFGQKALTKSVVFVVVCVQESHNFINSADRKQLPHGHEVIHTLLVLKILLPWRIFMKPLETRAASTTHTQISTHCSLSTLSPLRIKG